MILGIEEKSAVLKTRPVAPADGADAVLWAISHEPNPAVLESSAMKPSWDRYSLYACQPIELLTLRNGLLVNHAGECLADSEPEIWKALSQAFSAIHVKKNRIGYGPGWIGYVGYEMGRYIEKLPGRANRDTSIPDLRLALYDAVLIHDVKNDHWSLAWWEFEGQTQKSIGLQKLEQAIQAPLPTELPSSVRSSTLEPSGNFTPQAYQQAVKKCLDYIAAGDIFQVNLSQRFEIFDSTDPLSVYRQLRKNNPAAYSAYLTFEGNDHLSCAVISSSPELFLRVRNGEVQTRPIKGTRRRTGEPLADSVAQMELKKSSKDHAELAMIVDLLRNDLGRVCRYGSVHVTEPHCLETHPTVYHLVATINGLLKENIGPAELLQATFPGGSITGAPKIRAMEIIDELEPCARGVYTGCIGWVGANGDCEWNIAIRTIVRVGNRTFIQAGGGIVADSIPKDEYIETLDKARALFAAVGVRID